jgi:hypothetical protein
LICLYSKIARVMIFGELQKAPVWTCILAVKFGRAFAGLSEPKHKCRRIPTYAPRVMWSKLD